MRRFLKNPVQLEFAKVVRPPTWGGARKGAGRPRTKNLLPHRARPSLAARFPHHVTLRIRRGIPTLRTRKSFARVKWAFRYGCDRFGMRLCEFSVQDNHIHLIVEAAGKDALS